MLQERVFRNTILLFNPFLVISSSMYRLCAHNTCISGQPLHVHLCGKIISENTSGWSGSRKRCVSELRPFYKTERWGSQTRVHFSVHGKKGFVIPTKSFVKIGITKIFCYNSKMFSSIKKTFGCCSKNFGWSNKKFISCCRNKTIFSVKALPRVEAIVQGNINHASSVMPSIRLYKLHETWNYMLVAF